MSIGEVLARAGVLAVLAGVLAGPVPAALERSGFLAARPCALLVTWCSWAMASSLVLIGCCASAGALIGTWLSGAGWAQGSGLIHGTGGGLLGAASATTWLVGASAVAMLRIGRVRRRHRDAVELVASFHGHLPAWIVEDPRPLAYTIPDRRSPAVVLTRGALQLTDDAELLAVLSHERQHGRRLPSAVRTAWAVWARVWPLRSLGRRVLPAVDVASEMIADEAARTVVGSQVTIAALCRLHTGLPAACDALGWEPDPATLRRVRRLLAVSPA